MSDKMITVSILGVGSRGVAYGTIMNSMPNKFDIVALCDHNKEKTERHKEIFGVSGDMVFDDEKTFFEKKRSDLLIIATWDDSHVALAKRAIPLGYKILLEKPISDKRDELTELREFAKKHNTFIMVCHVLRYTWANRTIMKVLRSGRLGKLIHIDHTEQIAYWHFAHSYTRGNWRNTAFSAPMIMAKSCHDLDLLQQYAGAKCESLSSVGDLTWFKHANAPEGCAERCVDCKYCESCAYSARNRYLDWWKLAGKPQCWPYDVLSVEPLTEEVLEKAIREGQYGRCVYRCDNNVADHQSVQMQFENGITATFNVTAFTKEPGRITIFRFSEGELLYEEEKGTIIEKPFRGENVVHRMSDLKDTMGHGGGDDGIVNALYAALTGEKTEADTSLENSIESHIMAIAAEDSRLAGGKFVEMKVYR